MLKIGWATRSITPERPVMLHGQMNVRISEGVENPVTVTALALEGDGEAVIFVGCDLVHVTLGLLAETRARLKALLPGFDVSRLILHATHTHTSLVYEDGIYTPPEGADVMPPCECLAFIASQVAAAAQAAWESRQPGTLARGYGQAVVGHNRRASYMDGSARMYGVTDTPAFSNIEGYEDHGVHLLYFFDAQHQLTGVLVNLACPSQETEHAMTVSADFWHEVRQEVRRRFGEGVYVLPQCSPAGDQSPHLLFLSQVEESMRALRGLTRRQEIGRRIADAVEDVYGVVKDVPAADAPAASLRGGVDPAGAHHHAGRLRLRRG